MRKRVTKYLKLKALDPLQVNFLSDIVKIINTIIAILLFLFIIGKQNIVASILGAGAISAFVIGFAFKDIGENFLAGIILAFKRPFKIGDTVMIDNIEGSVLDLNLRETHIKTFDGKDVYIPNGILLKNPLYNYTIDGFLRQQFILGFDYGTNLSLARTTILETVNRIPGVLQETKPAKTFIQEAGPYKIFIVTQYWINTINNPYSGTEIKSQAIKDSLSALENKELTVTSQKIKMDNVDNLSGER
jgi:small-conductance mechanosensitive channel